MYCELTGSAIQQNENMNNTRDHHYTYALHFCNFTKMSFCHFPNDNSLVVTNRFLGLIQYKDLTSITNSFVGIRWFYDRLISTMAFSIPARRHINIESGSRYIFVWCGMVGGIFYPYSNGFILLFWGLQQYQWSNSQGHALILDLVSYLHPFGIDIVPTRSGIDIILTPTQNSTTPYSHFIAYTPRISLNCLPYYSFILARVVKIHDCIHQPGDCFNITHDS